MQGLINAIAELAPHAEHRNCVRHVYCNWKKIHKGQTLKNIFWKIAKSTYVEAYKLALEELKDEDYDAYQNFLEREPKRFCKAFISTRPLCDIIDNNVSETFNGFILQARGKPLIDMLNEIRDGLMERLYNKLSAVSGANEKLCKTIKTKLDRLKYESRLCTCVPSSQEKFQVCHREDQFVVNICNKTCTCRGWDLTGIPCIHACSVMTFLNLDPTELVAECYTVVKYIEAYRHGIEPLNGPKMWPTSEGYPVVPPIVRKMPGRPPKKRKRCVSEKETGDSKVLPRFGTLTTCQRCFQVGHNKRTCKNAAVDRPPKTNVRH